MNTVPGYRELMHSRPPEFDHEDGQFWILGEFNGGFAWVGRFRGVSPWTRHPGESFFCQVEGSVTWELLAEGGDRVHTVAVGSSCLIPRGTWYRFIAADWVVQTGANPGQTEHHQAEGRPS